jgi:UDP-GlcNAc:undecaprenyl-phosphate GlcNAc-1-phosphate transferase
MAEETWHLMSAAAMAAVATSMVTPALAWIARRLDILDHPGGYKAHSSPTPLLGGLGVAAGVVAGIAPALADSSNTELAGISALAVGGITILAAGLIDDVHGLAPRQKFSFQIAATAIAGSCLAILGVRLDLFLHWPPVPIVLLTVLWIVGITNAVNFLDNMNGLCAGLGAVAATSLAMINLRSGEFTVALVAASLAGGCIGFLPFNFPRARIFLGDTGAMLIGFLLAALSVMGVYTRGAEVPVLAVFTPLFVLGMPVLDSILVIVLRLAAGHPPWVGDQRHISHRLVRRGLHPAPAVVVLWAAGIACGLAAVLLPTVGVDQAPLLLALLLCALGALAGAAGTEGPP